MSTDRGPSLPHAFRSASSPIDLGAKQIILHPLEKALAIPVGALLIFLPWAKGTMHPWSQTMAAMLALVALVIALWPRHYTPDLTGGPNFILYTWPKLLRFPPFWLGLGLLIYILIQALNPAWEYHKAPEYWYMLPRDYVEWLPSGMITPFEMTNPWRYLLIYGTAWATVCAVWIGFTRRKPVQVLVYVFVASGSLLAAVGIVQKLAGATKMLWSFDPRASYFFGTFVYKNHAAAYLNLVLAAVLGLALWHHDRGARRMKKSDPSIVLFFVALILFIADVFTNSRAGMIIGAALLAFGLLRYVGIWWQNRGTGGNPLVMMFVTSFFMIFAGIGVAQLDLDVLAKRFTSLVSDTSNVSTTGRIQVTQATGEMFSDKAVYGWGAGSYRFYFPVYQQRYPEIHEFVRWKNPKTGQEIKATWFWEYAHNDYVQFLAELGLVGSFFVLGMLGYWVYCIFVSELWRHPFSLAIVVGLTGLAAHCWMDFHTHSPAILITLTTLATFALLWVEHEKTARGER